MLILFQLAEYILPKMKMEINYWNYEGHTALDILNQAGSASVIQHLKDQIMKAGGKMGIELPQSLIPEIPKDALENEHTRSLAHIYDIQMQEHNKAVQNQDREAPKFRVTTYLNRSPHQKGVPKPSQLSRSVRVRNTGEN